MLHAHWWEGTSIQQDSPLPLDQARLRSAAGVREGRGRDDLTDEIAKRKRRRASSHTKSCFPKAKARLCRRMAKREKSKLQNLYFIQQVLLLSVRWTSRKRRFPPTENGIEWTALSARHSFPRLYAAFGFMLSTRLHLLCWYCLRVFHHFIGDGWYFVTYQSRLWKGEKNNIASTTLFLCCALDTFYVPQPHQCN